MKKTFLKAAVLLCAGIGITACGSGKQAVQAIDLTGEWNIVTVNGDTIEAENTPYLGLDMQCRMQPHDGYIRSRLTSAGQNQIRTNRHHPNDVSRYGYRKQSVASVK